jgi:hypothetical protein
MVGQGGGEAQGVTDPPPQKKDVQFKIVRNQVSWNRSYINIYIPDFGDSFIHELHSGIYYVLL